MFCSPAQFKSKGHLTFNNNFQTGDCYLWLYSYSNKLPNYIVMNLVMNTISSFMQVWWSINDVNYTSHTMLECNIKYMICWFRTLLHEPQTNCFVCLCIRYMEFKSNILKFYLKFNDYDKLFDARDLPFYIYIWHRYLKMCARNMLYLLKKKIPVLSGT